MGALDGWIDVCRVGTWRDVASREVDVTHELLESIVSNFTAQDRTPVVVGHPADDAPAFGRVGALRKVGDRLQASLRDLMPEFRAAVEAGRYVGRSIAFKDGKLRHVGFLGGRAPAVPGLAPTQFGAAAADTVMLAAPLNDQAVLARFAVERGSSHDVTVSVLQLAEGAAPEGTRIGERISKAADAAAAVNMVVNRKIVDNLLRAAKELLVEAKRLCRGGADYWSGLQPAIDMLADAERAIEGVKTLEKTGDPTLARRALAIFRDKARRYRRDDGSSPYDVVGGAGGTAVFHSVAARLLARDEARHDFADRADGGQSTVPADDPASTPAIAGAARALLAPARKLGFGLSTVEAVDVARVSFGEAPSRTTRNLVMALSAAELMQSGLSISPGEALAAVEGRPSNAILAAEARA